MLTIKWAISDYRTCTCLDRSQWCGGGDLAADKGESFAIISRQSTDLTRQLHRASRPSLPTKDIHTLKNQVHESFEINQIFNYL